MCVKYLKYNSRGPKQSIFCELKVFPCCPSSYDDYYTEDDPVYGNLNQEILGKLHFDNTCLFRGCDKCVVKNWLTNTFCVSQHLLGIELQTIILHYYL